MVKKAQIRFIAVTMTILFAVFAVIFGVMWAISGENLMREIQISVDDVEKQYNGETSERFPKVAAVVEVSDYGNFTLKDGDAEIFSTELLEKIAESVKSVPSTKTGNVDDFYYKKTRDGAAWTVFIVDMSFETARFHSLLLKTLITLTAVLFALFFVVWAFSAKVFEPIKRILANQKQFISDASHELKTPVSIISANADVVRTEENAAYVDSIKKQVERLKF